MTMNNNQKKLRIVVFVFFLSLSIYQAVLLFHDYYHAELTSPSASVRWRNEQQEEEDTSISSSSSSLSSQHATKHNTTSRPAPAAVAEVEVEASTRSTTPSSSTTRPSGHCIFVVTKIFGRHDLARKNATLNWFLGATVNSIHLAADRAAAAQVDNDSAVKHVGLHLYTQQLYATELVQREISDLYYRMYPSRDVDLVLQNHTDRMRQTASEKQCRFVSIMRIDADDMFLPNTFQRISQRWNEKALIAKCSSSSKEKEKNNGDGSYCDVVMVTGMQALTTLSIHPPSSPLPPTLQQLHKKTPSTMSQQQQQQQQATMMMTSSSQCYQCSLEQKKKNFLFSLGLAVTMPIQIWLKHYGGNERVINQKHTLVLPNVQSEMSKMNITTVVNNVTDLGLYMKTPLSGHYVFPQSNKTGKAKEAVDGDKCDLEWLSHHLGNEAGQMVWNVRSYLPDLSTEQWCQNHFVTNVTEQKELKNLHEEICNRPHQQATSNGEKFRQ